MENFIYQVYFQNTIARYLWALGTLVVGILVITLAKLILKKRLKARRSLAAQPVDNGIADRMLKYVPLLLYIGVLYFSISMLFVTPYVHRIINIIVLALSTFCITYIISNLIEYSINKYAQKVCTDANKLSAMHWVSKFTKFVLWTIAIIIFIDNLGINISTLIAGLGIGGIAVAFAAQAILEDIFSYFTIFFDRPFEVGDFLITGEYQGTVEHIGLRTTRLRSVGGEQLVFPNKDLTNSRVKNYKGMEQRRVLFTLSVTHDTSQEQLKLIPEMIKTIVEQQENTLFDRAHFNLIGSSGLNFEVVYYVLSSDYKVYMDILQQVNLQIKDRFDQLGIKLAYPTQTIHLNNQ